MGLDRPKSPPPRHTRPRFISPVPALSGRFGFGMSKSSPGQYDPETGEYRYPSQRHDLYAAIATGEDRAEVRAEGGGVLGSWEYRSGPFAPEFTLAFRAHAAEFFNELQRQRRSRGMRAYHSAGDAEGDTPFSRKSREAIDAATEAVDADTE